MVTAWYKSVGLLLLDPLHISHLIGQGSMVTDREEEEGLRRLPFRLSHSTKAACSFTPCLQLRTFLIVRRLSPFQQILIIGHKHYISPSL